MNRKSRFGLKNKKTQISVSLIQKFVLVLALFVIMVTTAHAGSFLTEGDIVLNDDYSNIVVNRSDNDYDSWASDDDYDPEMTLDVSSYPNGFGYLSRSNDYTGFYIGTFEENNNSEDGLLALIRHFLNDDTIELLGYAKHDLPDEFETNEDLDYELNVTVEPADSEDLSATYSGTWDVVNTQTNSAETINFYSVKGSTEYALYYVDPALSSGNWTSRHLLTPEEENDGSTSIPALSHFTAMMTTDPVPEPATMLLFGFSLMGLAGMARRKNSKF